MTTHGTMDYEAFVRMTRETLARARSLQLLRFLVDHRDIHPVVGAAELCELPEDARREGLDARMRVAIVYAADSPQRDDFTFYQMMVWSIGADYVQLYTDIDAAMEWLLEAP